MIIEQIQTLCDRIKLGKLIVDPTPVSGGMQNQMFHLKTTKGEYAAKILNSDYMEKNEAINEYESSEAIARNFADFGIPAITAITHKDHSVIELYKKYYMIFPWSKALRLDRYAVSKAHAVKIGGLIGKIHKLNLHTPSAKQRTWATYTNEDIQKVSEIISGKKMPFAGKLEAELDAIYKWNDKYLKAIPVIEGNLVLSHGDLDQTNILWDECGNPMIIDWEFVGLFNPTQEIINQALNWSGLSSYKLNRNIFKAILLEYRKSSGKNFDNVGAAFCCISGDWINWLVENLKLSLTKNITSKEEFQLSIEEKIDYALKVLPYLVSNVVELEKLSED